MLHLQRKIGWLPVSTGWSRRSSGAKIVSLKRNRRNRKRRLPCHRVDCYDSSPWQAVRRKGNFGTIVMACHYAPDFAIYVRIEKYMHLIKLLYVLLYLPQPTVMCTTPINSARPITPIYYGSQGLKTLVVWR